MSNVLMLLLRLRQNRVCSLSYLLKLLLKLTSNLSLPYMHACIPNMHLLGQHQLQSGFELFSSCSLRHLVNVFLSLIL